jgi:hypothetical protein
MPLERSGFATIGILEEWIFMAKWNNGFRDIFSHRVFEIDNFFYKPTIHYSSIPWTRRNLID